jgi:group II intron reverse transcriptase/maturase
VIDVDIKNFFGTIDHKILVGMIREKIKDTRFIRYLVRTLKAGVLTGTDVIVSDEGVAQGSPCSPVLANIFAHNVIDKWFEEVVKPRCRGTVALHRYCDDCVICCSVSSDAPRIQTALENRLRKFGLQLNTEKTKTVQFSTAGYGRGEKQQTFDFLGFTFYIAPTRKGIVTTKVKTSGKRIRAKLKKVRLWCKQTVNRLPLHQIWKKFCIKMTGHIRYYGVSYNCKHVRNFLYQASRILFEWLNRRSQRKSYTWEQFGMFKKQFPAPEVKIYHRLF